MRCNVGGSETGAFLGRCNILVLYLQKNQPAVVPAADAVRIPNNEPFCFVETLRAEGVVLCEASELAEEVVGVDVVGPGGCHWFCDFGGVEVCEDFLNPAQFRDGVDTMSSEGVDELVLVVLQIREVLVGDSGELRGVIKVHGYARQMN